MWCLSTEDVGVSWTEWHLTSSSSLSSSTRRHTISTRPPSDSSRVHPSRRANSRQDPPHCPDTARCRARSLQYRRRICCRPFCPRNCSTNITLTLSSRIAKLDVYTEYLTFYVSAAYAAPEALFYRVRHGFCPVCCLVPNIFLSLCKNSEPVSMKFAAGHHCYEHLNDYISAETGTRTP